MYRLLLFETILVLFGATVQAAFSPAADGVTGTWKRSAMTILDGSGKTTDMMAMMARSMPCTKDITYTFTSNGKMDTSVPDACGAMKKAIESMNATGQWVMAGRKLTVSTTMKDFPPATYDVTFAGNTMTWVFSYADNPKTPNPTKAQRLTIVYQRV